MGITLFSVFLVVTAVQSYLGDLLQDFHFIHASAMHQKFPVTIYAGCTIRVCLAYLHLVSSGKQVFPRRATATGELCQELLHTFGPGTGKQLQF